MKRLALVILLLLTTPVWAAITEDTGSPWTTSNHLVTTTTLTVTITTAGTNRMIVAEDTCGGAGAVMSSTSISGGGLAWTNRASAIFTGTNANLNGAEVWTAPAAAALTSQVITFTRAAGTSSCILSVHAYVGALTSGVGASATFSDNSSGGVSHLVGVSITPNVTGSVVACPFDDGNSATALVANGSTTVETHVEDTGDGDAIASAHLTGTTTAATPVSCAANKNDLFVTAAALEICPASGCSAGGVAVPTRTLMGVGP